MTVGVYARKRPFRTGPARHLKLFGGQLFLPFSHGLVDLFYLDYTRPCT
jgi:hypothetical protein